MTHEDAQRELSVERYLLDELQGDARDDFEEHLFECEICAADLRAGADFTEALRAGTMTAGPQLVRKAEPAAATPATGPRAAAEGRKFSSWAASLLQPWFAVPAFAALLAVIGIQSLVVQPRLHHEIASLQTPAVISNLTIHASRSGGTSEVLAHGGGFLLSLDIPAESRFRAYRCTLISPVGRPVWHTYLSPAQVGDTVLIHVPVGTTNAGTNVLKIEGIPQGEGGAAVSILQRSFTLKIGE